MQQSVSRDIKTPRRLGSEKQVSQLTGESPKTLQKKRLFGKGYPYYKVGTRVLYDLDEVEQIILAGRVEVNR